MDEVNNESESERMAQVKVMVIKRKACNHRVKHIYLEGSLSFNIILINTRAAR